MTMPARPDPAALEQLLALVGEALALSDAQALHATGIALDTARLSVADALAEARQTTEGGLSARTVRQPSQFDPKRGHLP